jgi:hypothetical protein
MMLFYAIQIVIEHWQLKCDTPKSTLAFQKCYIGKRVVLASPSGTTRLSANHTSAAVNRSTPAQCLIRASKPSAPPLMHGM